MLNVSIYEIGETINTGILLVLPTKASAFKCGYKEAININRFQ